ncbi:MAG TPA: hypothetical protein VML75_11310 [Kofleriaceae bacterium]|nr:hypothetical protein [Kofleriaceae bacterium]
MNTRVGVAFVAVALLAPGCMPVSNYHSARTLGDGESSWGMTFSSTTYQTNEGRVTVPGIIPEVTYHIGLTDDVEFGGRVAPGFLSGELDLKYRFLHEGPTHLAIAPALGQMAFWITITSVRLPLILTYELNDKVALNTGVAASAWIVSDTGGEDRESPFGGVGEDVLRTATGFVGLDIQGRTAYIRPTIEFTRAVFGNQESSDFEMLQFSVHFGFISGRELKKLDQMQEQLDRIENKVSWKDRRNPNYVAANEP